MNRLEESLTCLTLHGPNSGVLVEQPVVRLIVLARSLRVRDLVLGVVALNKVLHDAARFEQVDGFAIGKLVGQSRNAAIGVDGKEPVFLLSVLADIDLLNLVGKTTTFSKAVRRPTRTVLTQAPLA